MNASNEIATLQSLLLRCRLHRRNPDKHWDVDSSDEGLQLVNIWMAGPLVRLFASTYLEVACFNP